MRDYHIHFTGSLPREYIFAKFLEYNKKDDLPLNMQEIKTYTQFLDKLNNSFSRDYQYNKIKFLRFTNYSKK